MADANADLYFILSSPFDRSAGTALVKQDKARK